MKSATPEHTMSKTIEPNRTEQPSRQAARRQRGELLRRIRSGPALTLAEYVRAEEALVNWLRSRAKRATAAYAEGIRRGPGTLMQSWRS